MNIFFTWNNIAPFLLAALISLLAIPPIVKVAHTKNLVVIPNNRTSHIIDIPAFGGVALFIAMGITSSLFLSPLSYNEFRFILPAIIIIFFVGMGDDLVGLKAYQRLIAQAVAASLIILFADIRIESLYGILGIYHLPYWVSFSFSLFIFISLINRIPRGFASGSRGKLENLRFS